MNVDYPILARAWKHFWEAAWEELEKDNNQMISCGEKNPDLFGSIQGLQNMTNVIMEWSGIDRESQMHKYRLRTRREHPPSWRHHDPPGLYNHLRPWP